jgi:type III pantothenate kinase
MRLLIDAGNTRIKWACVQEDEWLHRGVIMTAQSSELPQHWASVQHKIRQIWVSNVAGAHVAAQLLGFGALIACEPHFIVAQAAQCGVHNGYDQPAQLGSDRWAGLIAAWHLLHRPCLVVSCGTATTIDALTEQGSFIGGLILPGIEMMQRSLTSGTAQLAGEQGRYEMFPLNTANAIYSGAVQAHSGAILQQCALLQREHDAVPVVLTGGAMPHLQPHLAQRMPEIPLHCVDDLVLQGLLRIAQEADL